MIRRVMRAIGTIGTKAVDAFYSVPALENMFGNKTFTDKDMLKMLAKKGRSPHLDDRKNGIYACRSNFRVPRRFKHVELDGLVECADMEGDHVASAKFVRLEKALHMTLPNAEVSAPKLKMVRIAEIGNKKADFPELENCYWRFEANKATEVSLPKARKMHEINILSATKLDMPGLEVKHAKMHVSEALAGQHHPGISLSERLNEDGEVDCYIHSSGQVRMERIMSVTAPIEGAFDKLAEEEGSTIYSANVDEEIVEQGTKEALIHRGFINSCREMLDMKPVELPLPQALRARRRTPVQ